MQPSTQIQGYEAISQMEKLWPLYDLKELICFSEARKLLEPIESVGLPLATLPLIWVISRRNLVSSQFFAVLRSSSQRPLPMRSACPAAGPASAPSWLRQVPGWLQQGLRAVGRVFLRVL